MNLTTRTVDEVHIVGVPLLPTLGSPTRSLDEIYGRLGTSPFTAEFKYDGQRAQIHASRGDGPRPFVKIFSRHLEDMTDKVHLTFSICASPLLTTSVSVVS